MFKPKLINVEKSQFNTDRHQAKRQLKEFNLVKIEVEKLIQLPTDNEDFTKLLKNPVNYIENYFKDSYASKLDIPISTKKLLELLEIDLTPLHAVLKNYKTNLITSIDCNVVSTVNEDNYKTYTTNQAENTRLKEFELFIGTFDKLVGTGHNNYNLHELNRMLGDKCYYEDGTLIPNLKYIKNV